MHGTWSCVVVVDLLEGVVEASRGEQERQWGGGVSVNSPPCIKNWHAGAALRVALTSPSKPPLTFPHSAGGCGSQRRLFLHFIQVSSELLSLVKHWRSWPHWPPSLPASVKITQAARRRASAALPACYEIMLPLFGCLKVYLRLKFQIKTKCRLDLISVFLHIKLLKKSLPDSICSVAMCVCVCVLWK